MKKDPFIFLKHILDSIEKIESYAKNISLDKLKKDVKLQDAIVRRIEISGEAVRNLSEDFKKKYPQVEWEEIIRTRNKMIHHYFGVDLNIVLDIVKKDLPKLKKQIEKIIKD